MRANTSRVRVGAVILVVGLLLVTPLLVGVFARPARALLNPAAVYCEALGYSYVIESTEAGSRGLCELPDSQRVDAWDFLKGRVALDWSYCARQDYEAKRVETSDICWDCTVCVLPDGAEAEVTQLMGLNFEETFCGDGSCGIPENFETCPGDCPSGGWDGYCDGVSDEIIDPDCEEGADPDHEVAGSGGSSWPLIGGIIAAVVVLGLVIGFFVMGRRRAPPGSSRSTKDILAGVRASIGSLLARLRR